MKKIAVLSGVVVLGLSAVMAGANTVDINTGSAAWKIASFQGLYTDAAHTEALKSVPYSGDNIGGAAYNIPANSAWVGAANVGDGSASWIAPNANGNTTGAFGLYTYELKIDASQLAGGPFVLSGYYSSDNYVAQITINGTAIVPTQEGLGGHGAIWGFEKAFSVGASGLSAPITIDVTVYNESTAGHFNADAFHGTGTMPDGPSDPLGFANPTGLILQGSVTSVPLPASVWGGSVVLGAVAVRRALRRR